MCLKLRQITIIQILVLALAACTMTPSNFEPAPVHRYGTVAVSTDVQSIRVFAGDTVSEISARYGVNAADIIALNNLSSPYRLQAGQRLRLPLPPQHRVRQGESLVTIARLYGKPTQEIATLNGLRYPYRIRAGQILRLPVQMTLPPLPGQKPVQYAATPRFSTRPPAASAAQPTPVQPSLPAAPPNVRYVFTPQADASNQGALSNYTPPAPVQAQPPVTTAPQASQRASDPIETVLNQARERFGTPEASRAQATRTAALPFDKAASPSGVRFSRPLSGPVSKAFGSKTDGGTHDGIRIAAPRGTAVRASAAGEVVYSGDELPGYGNIMLVKHGGGWFSSYAHLDKRLVEKGDSVAAGETLGTVGKTGGALKPELYFEIRKNGKPQDPEKYI